MSATNAKTGSEKVSEQSLELNSIQNAIQETPTCIIVGASHGGVNAAFSLRKEGWQGDIILIDADPALPYHRPPLSKAYLTEANDGKLAILKPQASYEKANIRLLLGTKVTKLDQKAQTIQLENNVLLQYHKLILATGASAFIPPISGIEDTSKVFTLRTSKDIDLIKAAFHQTEKKRVVIIGGGYIGLETAASIKKLGGQVTVLEREQRLLARVTSADMSEFFQQLHTNNGILVKTGQSVCAMRSANNEIIVDCDDNSQYTADIVIVGVGVKVNQALAEQAGLTLQNGIEVNHQCQTSIDNIYAIGDCAFHHNQYYNRWLRLESVQNAVDQAKVAAASICEKEVSYDAIPWFWSDQFNVKLQMVGLNTGFDQVIIRKENDDAMKFSAWYFNGEQLLSVDTVNHAKAYVLATKLLKQRSKIDKSALANSDIALSLDRVINS
ncbi:NAD(P)/FAD-dependent oxidoreductase [Thalassotalea sp. PLHSN55]|uniref:NAD(P)/FAD-dependent oxidoreductase n=1 Tax=Thalassotalea sp. PLHSN55 TaxID=3435888 RepID=UPI003F84A058